MASSPPWAQKQSEPWPYKAELRELIRETDARQKVSLSWKRAPDVKINCQEPKAEKTLQGKSIPEGQKPGK